MGSYIWVVQRAELNQGRLNFPYLKEIRTILVADKGLTYPMVLQWTWYCWLRVMKYCWWFRNPTQPPKKDVQIPANTGIKLPTSTGERRISEPSTLSVCYLSPIWYTSSRNLHRLNRTFGGFPMGFSPCLRSSSPMQLSWDRMKFSWSAFMVIFSQKMECERRQKLQYE